MSDKADIQSFLDFFDWRKMRFDYLGGFLCQYRSEIKLLKHYGKQLYFKVLVIFTVLKKYVQRTEE